MNHSSSTAERASPATTAAYDAEPLPSALTANHDAELMETSVISIATPLRSRDVSQAIDGEKDGGQYNEEEDVAHEVNNFSPSMVSSSEDDRNSIGPITGATSAITSPGVLSPKPGHGRLSPSSAVSEEVDNICAVCYDAKVEYTMLPCGHKVLCGECAERLINEDLYRCIMCRQRVECLIKEVDGTLQAEVLHHSWKTALSTLAKMTDVTTTVEKVGIALWIVVAVAGFVTSGLFARQTSRDGRFYFPAVPVNLAFAVALWSLNALLIRSRFALNAIGATSLVTSAIVGGLWTLCHGIAQSANSRNSTKHFITSHVVAPAVCIVIMGLLQFALVAMIGYVGWSYAKNSTSCGILTGVIAVAAGICANTGVIYSLTSCPDYKRSPFERCVTASSTDVVISIGVGAAHLGVCCLVSVLVCVALWNKYPKWFNNERVKINRRQVSDAPPPVMNPFDQFAWLTEGRNGTPDNLNEWEVFRTNTNTNAGNSPGALGDETTVVEEV